jgi:hypothetical protein
MLDHNPQKRTTPQVTTTTMARASSHDFTARRDHPCLPDTPPSRADQDLVSWGQAHYGLLPITCLRCGGKHDSRRCRVAFIEGTVSPVRLQGFTIRTYRLNGSKICFDFDHHGCEKEDKYPHVCSLCASPYHGVKACIQYRREELAAAYRAFHATRSPSKRSSSKRVRWQDEIVELPGAIKASEPEVAGIVSVCSGVTQLKPIKSILVVSKATETAVGTKVKGSEGMCQR